ncbi:MAG: hypothetical protein HY046_10360 [Acidobacteria bacterium]|nr:hypothetical protein [Acidobacteriota bacterium]
MAAPVWLWPEVGTLPDAEDAINHGKYAAAAVALITALVATVALVSGNSILGVNAWAYVDAIIFAVIAFGISRKSRFAAVAGLVLYILERIAMGMPAGIAGIVLPFIFVCMFISGVRGTFAHQNLKQKEPAPATT